MPMFSRLRAFTCVCLGFALMFLGNTADVYAQGVDSLVVIADAGEDVVYEVGDTVAAEFLARIDGFPESGVQLTIESTGIGNLTISGGGMTNVVGVVEVSGTLLVEEGAYISATWEEKDKETTVFFKGIHVGVGPAIIVVNSPDPKFPLAVGDIFTQMISIENRGKWPTLPLSAWQMAVVFNSSILEVVDVTEGDFLESDGEDARYTNIISPGRIRVNQARRVLLPGISLAPGDTGELLTITFKVLAVSEEALGIHNVQLLSLEDDNEDGTLDRISYSILVSDVFGATHQESFAKEDVNQDGMVNILDLVMVAGSIGMVRHNPLADVNGDGFVNVLDLVTIYVSPLWGISAAPSASGNVDLGMIQAWIDLAQVEDDGSAIFDLGITNLEALLASRIPTQTRLLLNYPNPFNPETWIPYQLAKATDVTVSIYSVNGSLIRTLALGHQAAGVYRSRSRAAYWDGRNELGERVASGLYFYTLTAGDFTATRKMLIRK